MMKQNNKNLDLAKLPKGLNKKQFLALPEMKNTRTIFLWTGIVEIIAGVFCLSRVAYFRFMIIPLVVDIVLGQFIILTAQLLAQPEAVVQRLLDIQLPAQHRKALRLGDVLPIEPMLQLLGNALGQATGIFNFLKI